MNKFFGVFVLGVFCWTAALVCTVNAQTIAICKGEYALCAASSTTPTGNLIKVNGKTFKEGVAVCPVLTGDAIANMDLMGGSCTAPKGKVWSLFGVPPVTSYPQAPSWAVAPAAFRSFTVGITPESGMSNMWSFLCEKQAKQVNGVTLANCHGPIMESPWTGHHVVAGETAFTQAPVGATYPVGGNKP
jgi:hypothetical protein